MKFDGLEQRVGPGLTRFLVDDLSLCPRRKGLATPSLDVVMEVLLARTAAETRREDECPSNPRGGCVGGAPSKPEFGALRLMTSDRWDRN